MDKIFFLELLGTYNAHWEQARKGFAQLELTEGVPKVLYTLRSCEGCVQKQLAEICQIKESTLAVLLKRLEGLGYITKKPQLVSGGKRAYGICFTEAGRKKSEEIAQLVDDIDRRSLEGFSSDDIERFFGYMEKVRKNLKE